MALGKQAKTLTDKQVNAVLNHLTNTRDPIRNKVIFLLSVKAGMRAKEIASLEWSMITDAEGKLTDRISLTDSASKGRSGRVIPINSDLGKALSVLMTSKVPAGRVIKSQRSKSVSAQTIINMFRGWYADLGMNGCSSHSGRRTFITKAARKVSYVGGSIRDVQVLAGHSSLAMTQRYIEADSAAQAKLVNLI
ncbi:MAG: site-specific integrase [Oceanospirillaceae bacterium]|nr:site-specific integrase [Oceanospirillaceae bacterium]